MKNKKEKRIKRKRRKNVNRRKRKSTSGVIHPLQKVVQVKIQNLDPIETAEKRNQTHDVYEIRAGVGLSLSLYGYKRSGTN